MHLYLFCLDRVQRVGYRIRIMRVCAGIDDEPVEAALLQTVDYRALRIGLEKLYFRAALFGELFEPRVDRVERFFAVDRFAPARHIEIDAVKYKYLHYRLRSLFAVIL